MAKNKNPLSYQNWNKDKKKAFYFSLRIGMFIVVINFVVMLNSRDIEVIIPAIVVFIGAIVSLILVYFSIINNKKNIIIGILDIIFCGIIGGIYYLIWIPVKVPNNNKNNKNK